MKKSIEEVISHEVCVPKLSLTKPVGKIKLNEVYDPDKLTIPQIIVKHFPTLGHLETHLIVSNFVNGTWGNQTNHITASERVVDDILFDGKSSCSNESPEWRLIRKFMEGRYEHHYIEQYDILVIRDKNNILGESYGDLRKIEGECNDAIIEQLVDNVANIAKHKKCRVVHLGNSTIDSTSKKLLQFNTNPGYETELTKKVLVFGELRNVMIPKVALQPMTGETMTEYINRGPNPYAKWDDFYRDTRTNIIYAVGNINMICILVKKNIISTINMVTFEVINSASDFETRLNIIYEVAKAKMLKKFEEQTTHTARKNYENLTGQVTKGKEKLADLRDQFAILGKKVFDAEKDIKYFDIDALTSDAENMAKTQFEKTYRIKGVSHIEYEDGMINVYTDNMYQKNTEEGHESWRDMGTFTYVINWDNEKFEDEYIKVYPTKWKNTSSTYITSHVMGSSKFCYGNSMNIFAEAYAARNLFGIVLNIMDMLRSQNISDGAAVADAFPVVSEAVALGEEFGKEISYTDLDPSVL